jgi:hypothetical protein
MADEDMYRAKLKRRNHHARPDHKLEEVAVLSSELLTRA